MQDLFSVAGKVALVTGGSRGIGLMIARGYVEGGAKVYISSRKADVCDEAAASLSEVGEAISVPADLSTLAGVEGLASAIAEREGALHVLVNNAGATWGEPIDSFSEEGWDKVVDLNLKSPFFMTKELLGLLRAGATAEDPARVINIASIDGIHVSDFESYSYAASKAGVIHLTRALAKRLVSDHINVNAIAPGLFPSKMTAFLFEQFEEAILQSIPQHRAGTAEDMAGTAIFLGSRASNYMTGQTLALDGGITGLS